VTEFKTKLFPLLPAIALASIAVVWLPAAPSAGTEAPRTSEAAGATLFRDKGCAYCHGANAQGTPKGPSLGNVRKTMKPAQIADQIKNGGQKMPSFADSLSDAEVDQLVAYLRARHRPNPAPLPTPPAQN